MIRDHGDINIRFVIEGSQNLRGIEALAKRGTTHDHQVKEGNAQSIRNRASPLHVGTSIPSENMGGLLYEPLGNKNWWFETKQVSLQRIVSRRWHSGARGNRRGRLLPPPPPPPSVQKERPPHTPPPPLLPSLP